MRCLYCGNRLALLRKLADAEFCSSSHRKLYGQEQEKMALARLVDAQRRFSKEVLGVSTEPETAQQAAAGREEAKGFLAHEPVARETNSIRRPETEPIGVSPETKVPFRNPMMPPETGCGLRLLAAPEPQSPETSQPRSSAQVEPELMLESPQPPEFLLAMEEPLLGECEGVAYGLVEAQLPAPRQMPLEAIEGEVAPVMPDSKWPAVSSLDLAALAISLKKQATPRSESAAAASKPVPEAVPESAPMIPLEVSPDINPEQLPVPESGRIMGMNRPAPVARGSMLRRVRVREAFFPLPRLGDLPALAARAAQTHIRLTQYRAAIGPDWTTGSMAPPSFPAQAQPSSLRSSRAEFGFEDPAHPSLECHLRLGETGAGPQIAMAGKVEVATACPAAFSASPLAPEDAAPDFAARCEVRLPVKPAVIQRTHLSAPSIPLQLECAGACGNYAPSVQVLEPRSWRTQADACLPALSCQIVSGRRIGEAFEMSAVAPRPAALPAQMATVEPAIEHRLEITLRPLVPQSAPEARFAPAAAAKMVSLPTLHLPATPAKPIATLELSALWPDPARCMPQLRTEVVEDSDVRDAVRRINMLLAQNRKWRLPSMPSLPAIRPDRRWAILMAPLVVMLSFYALTRQEPTQLGAVNPEPEAQNTGMLDSSMASVRQTLLKRAAVSLSDDFRSGLGDWEGKGDWSRSWSYDPAGFLNTGPLALYTPSMSLSDYTVEFLGQIEKKSIGWVFRAKDLGNYYATKITLVNNGPIPSALIDRYAVINGKEDRREKRILPIQVRPDTLYRVRIDVRGSGFTLSVQGRLVDHWSDERITAGGIGFFSGKGEQARLRWVEVTHQYDFLGRLCAFLAPYSPAKEGSLKQ